MKRPYKGRHRISDKCRCRVPALTARVTATSVRVWNICGRCNGHYDASKTVATVQTLDPNRVKVRGQGTAP